MDLVWALPAGKSDAQQIAARARAYGFGVFTIESAGAIEFGGSRSGRMLLSGYSSLPPEEIVRDVERLRKPYE